ncbi:MAG: hypothetical protein M0C28_37670 [Candidatus Moduliflexus flocculans]|nr:hypothetical protein [Candidatus Moduliflexus flocculans]
MNLTWLRSGRYARALEDVRAVVDAAGGILVKLILEVTYLDEERIRRGCEIGLDAGVGVREERDGLVGFPHHPRAHPDHGGRGRRPMQAQGGRRSPGTAKPSLPCMPWGLPGSESEPAPSGASSRGTGATAMGTDRILAFDLGTGAAKPPCTTLREPAWEATSGLIRPATQGRDSMSSGPRIGGPRWSRVPGP